jgi:hypothetical protein
MDLEGDPDAIAGLDAEPSGSRGGRCGKKLVFGASKAWMEG